MNLTHFYFSRPVLRIASNSKKKASNAVEGRVSACCAHVGELIENWGRASSDQLGSLDIICAAFLACFVGRRRCRAQSARNEKKRSSLSAFYLYNAPAPACVRVFALFCFAI